MKTFLNVLYRRILYKIPLKLLLVLLAVFGILFACFSSAVNLPSSNWEGNILNTNGVSYTYSPDQVLFDYNVITPIDITDSNNLFTCFRGTVGGCFSYSSSSNFDNYTSFGTNYLLCTDKKNFYMRKYCNNDSATVAFYYYNEGDFYMNLNQYTSLQCQTEYNLIPISSVDQNYCTTNNLCPSSDCPVCPPSGGSGFSNVYINDILHIGAPNIIMNISEEIDWDYAYTQGGQNMNIDVVGYNVDYDKIDSIVEFQNYKPTSEDFQRIIGLLAPYTKIIVFFVFLFIIWAWIKKPFKSKKL